MLKTFKDALDAGQIEPAVLPDGKPFIMDGVQYYQATAGGINMLMGRFHAFSDTLRRHDTLKLDNQLLTTGFAALLTLLKRIRAQASLDTEQVLDATQEAITLIDRLEQRRAFGLDVSQVYEIASVYYFGENEDPGSVDTVTNQAKIHGWLPYPELYAFFLRMPVAAYFDSPALSDESILTYILQANRLELLDWSRMQLILKMSGNNSATISTIELRKATLFAYDGLLDQLLKTTTTIVPPGSGTPSEQP